MEKTAKEENKIKDYRMMAEHFRSDQYISKQMTEEFKSYPEFNNFFFINYLGVEKFRSLFMTQDSLRS